MEKFYTVRLNEAEARDVHRLVQDYLLQTRGIGKYTPAILTAEVTMTTQLFEEQGLTPFGAELVGEPYVIGHVSSVVSQYRISVRDAKSPQWVDVYVSVDREDDCGNVYAIKLPDGDPIVEYPFEVDEDWIILSCLKRARGR